MAIIENILCIHPFPIFFFLESIPVITILTNAHDFGCVGENPLVECEGTPRRNT